MRYTLHGRYPRKDVRAMSYMVARMQKMKADNLVGVGNHNQRKISNHSNKDIDVERSHLNYDLVNRTENYKTDIQKFVDEKKSTKRAVRKDAVLVNEWIVTSDSEFFENKDDKEIKEFFDKSKDYFAEKFGDDNIRYAQVHLDESTPHMHLGIVPFDDNQKLSAKRVFNRETMQKIQDELPEYMNEKGFDIERGKKGSKREHLSVDEYKQVIRKAEKEADKIVNKANEQKIKIENQYKEKGQFLETKRNDLANVNPAIKQEPIKNLFGKETEFVKVKKADLSHFEEVRNEQYHNAYERARKSKIDYEQEKRAYESVKLDNDRLNSKVETLQKELDAVTETKDYLMRLIGRVKDFFALENLKEPFNDWLKEEIDKEKEQAQSVKSEPTQEQDGPSL